MIKPNCDKCGNELKEFGGILLSPPDKDNKVVKDHLCVKCYDTIKNGTETKDLKTPNRKIGKATSKTMMSFKDLVKYTGLSKGYLYKLTSTGAIPHYKPFGKVLFFDVAEIDAFLRQNRRASTDELEVEANTYVTLKR